MVEAGSTVNCPFYILLHAISKWCGGCVVKDPASFGNIRIGERNITGLFRQAIDVRFHAGGFLDAGDELGKRVGRRAAEVDDFERGGGVTACGHDALNDVVDVGVIASGTAIAVLVDRLAGHDVAAELRDGEVRPLAWAVDREKAQADAADAVKVRIVGAELLARQLGGGVGGNGPLDQVVFGERDFFIHAIDRRR